MDLIIQQNCLGIDWDVVPEILKLGGMGYHEPQVHQKAFENSESVVFVRLENRGDRFWASYF